MLPKISCSQRTTQLFNSILQSRKRFRPDNADQIRNFFLNPSSGYLVTKLELDAYLLMERSTLRFASTCWAAAHRTQRASSLLHSQCLERYPSVGLVDKHVVFRVHSNHRDFYYRRQSVIHPYNWNAFVLHSFGATIHSLFSTNKNWGY